MTTRLYGLGTALPEHTATQDHSQEFMRRVFQARTSGVEQERALMYLEAIHENCGVERRYSVVEDFTRSDPDQFTFFPKNWSLEPVPSTRRRMEIYESKSIELAESAARSALDDADVSADEVTHLVFVSCTGHFAPGPDILLVNRLDLSPQTRRTVIGFMGCYGAFNGLRSADQIVASDPDAVVLEVCVELCTLHYQLDVSPETIISNSLFADGAAAAVYGAERRSDGGYADIATTHCQIGDDSLDMMQWHIGDTGFSMGLDADVPDELAKGGAPFIDALADRARMSRDDIGAWLVHPGGPRIVDAIAEVAELDDQQVALSHSILRDFGNMSSSTILFVLRRYLDRQPDAGPMALLGFGPGLTMEGAILNPV